MTMRLAGATVIPTIEECKQLLPLAALRQAVVVRADARIGCSEVICFEEV